MYQNSMITNRPIVSADDFDVKVGSILFWLLNIEPILVVTAYSNQVNIANLEEGVSRQ